MKKPTRIFFLSLFFLCQVMAACHSSDRPSLAALLPGTWYVADYTLQMEGDESAELSIDRIVFDREGRFQIFYPNEERPDEGGYEAGNDYIRLEYEQREDEYVVLFRVHDYSANSLSLSYSDSDRHISGTMLLSRERPAGEAECLQ